MKETAPTLKTQTSTEKEGKEKVDFDVEKLPFLKQGEFLSLLKIEQIKGSKIEVDTELYGLLDFSVEIGSPIIFKGGQGNTSKVTEIYEEDGRMFIKTKTSTYEVTLGNGVTENYSDAKEEIKFLKEKEIFEKQPTGVKIALEDCDEAFVKSCEIDGVQFILSERRGHKIMALVRDPQSQDVFQVRYFRMSGSDHQWKAVPAYRADESNSTMKGDENDPLHHYVQSAKLDKRLYALLDQLPENKNRSFDTSYIMPSVGKKGFMQRQNEFVFSEKNVELQSKSWAEVQAGLRKMNDWYTILGSENRNEGIGPSNSVGTFCTKFPAMKGLSELKPLQKAYEELVSKIGEEKLSKTKIRDAKYSKEYILTNFFMLYQEGLQKFFKAAQSRYSKVMEERGMIPEFSIANRRDTYKKGNILVEEFTVVSKEGDVLVWAMAQDEKGRVYVDNVYDPLMPIDTYGTPSLKCNMGFIVYKPEDYTVQTMTIPSDMKEKSKEPYTDISKFFEGFSIIQRYKEYLNKK